MLIFVMSLSRSGVPAAIFLLAFPGLGVIASSRARLFFGVSVARSPGWVEMLTSFFLDPEEFRFLFLPIGAVFVRDLDEVAVREFCGWRSDIAM